MSEEEYPCFVCDGTKSGCPTDNYFNLPLYDMCAYKKTARNDLNKYHTAKQGTEIKQIIEDQSITLGDQIIAYLKSRE